MSTKELTRPAAPAATQSKDVSVRRIIPFDLLQNEIGRVFDTFSGWSTPFAEHAFSPNMEVIETDNAIEVTTELPGIDEKDVEISVSDGVLTIRGEKKFEKDEKKKDYHLVERSYGSFQRSVTVPQGVDSSTVKAKLTKGVLKVEIPKPAASKSQSVKITTE